MAGERPGDGGVGHSWFAIEVTSQPVVEPGVPEFGGSDLLHTLGAGPIGSRVEIDIPGEISLGRPVEIEVAGQLALAQAFSAEFPVTIPTGKVVSLAVPGERAPGTFFASLLREDEELLLLT